MPHLVTIIKYACYIVKYLLVSLSAPAGKADGFVWRTVQVVPFVWIAVHNGFVW